MRGRSRTGNSGTRSACEERGYADRASRCDLVSWLILSGPPGSTLTAQRTWPRFPLSPNSYSTSGHESAQKPSREPPSTQKSPPPLPPWPIRCFGQFTRDHARRRILQGMPASRPLPDRDHCAQLDVDTLVIPTSSSLGGATATTFQSDDCYEGRHRQRAVLSPSRTLRPPVRRAARCNRRVRHAGRPR
jgi:hypothetical protein